MCNDWVLSASPEECVNRHGLQNVNMKIPFGTWHDGSFLVPVLKAARNEDGVSIGGTAGRTLELTTFFSDLAIIKLSTIFTGTLACRALPPAAYFSSSKTRYDED
jgi:hypothetical protein